MKKKPENKIERRFIPNGAAEIRLVKKEDEPTKIVGYFAKFNSLSENLGGFSEIIEPGFFRDALKNSDTVDLLNHDSNYVLGRTSAGTLRLIEDKVGLRYECDAPDTQIIKDLVISPIERGDITGNSFGFTLNGDGDTWEEDDDGRVIRTLKAGGCKDLFDGSQVTFPAYPDTDVALRSLDNFKKSAATRGGNQGATALDNFKRQIEVSERL